jgi:hypothetical protein
VMRKAGQQVGPTRQGFQIKILQNQFPAREKDRNGIKIQ